jgi:hypothetical protein
MLDDAPVHAATAGDHCNMQLRLVTTTTKMLSSKKDFVLNRIDNQYALFKERICAEQS